LVGSVVTAAVSASPSRSVSLNTTLPRTALPGFTWYTSSAPTGPSLTGLTLTVGTALPPSVVRESAEGGQNFSGFQLLDGRPPPQERPPSGVPMGRAAGDGTDTIAASFRGDHGFSPG
jgi:hypothetical protein